MNQELATDEAVCEFSSKKYGAKFPLYSKVHIPVLFASLTSLHRLMSTAPTLSLCTRGSSKHSLATVRLFFVFLLLATFAFCLYKSLYDVRFSHLELCLKVHH
jgi:hypothetical protein